MIPSSRRSISSFMNRHWRAGDSQLMAPIIPTILIFVGLRVGHQPYDSLLSLLKPDAARAEGDQAGWDIAQKRNLE